MLNIGAVLKSLSEKRPIFHSEADFQHSLAWEIREHYPDSKIRLETKVHGANTKVYLDILVVNHGIKYAIELKYKTLSYDAVVDGEEFSLNNQGAQDIGRYDVLKDIQRLEEMLAAKVADKGFLIFLTNDKSYFSNPNGNKKTVDQNFRLHEGNRVGGKLYWTEEAGKGTIKGREEPINLHGEYEMKWGNYSQIDDSPRGDFRCLLLEVDHTQSQSNENNSLRGVPITEKVEASVKPSLQKVSSPSWFNLFSQKRKIPTSQMDLRDKIATHLRQMGFSVTVNREIGRDKIDIWAEKSGETIAIEVRYKTALLQTIYNGMHIHLKHQGAQDISRYDYISDLQKLERVTKQRQGVKGYAILITNDHLYWEHPRKQNTVDEAFHIHDRHVVTGVCSWKEEASPGTTSARENPIRFTNSYVMKWKPYLTLGTKKNEQFQALVVEI